ncbi:unnamed protein product [Thelazia callipaeda]|uniref:DAGKc domain-containing protein n=1 Tax=Thelazia callipaeda TaxID=103827 RepID=A0A0N5CKV5_THECL|nr:unnamed protein product [Thelazia callipaeda]
MGAQISKINNDPRSVLYKDVVNNTVYDINIIVIINKKQYKIDSCVQTDNEISLEYANFRSIQLKYEDLVESKVRVNDDKTGVQLNVIAYAFVKAKRRFIHVTLTFSKEIEVENVNKYITQKITALKAPHLPDKFPRSRRRVLVFVNPFGGRKRGFKLWQKYVKPTLTMANIDFQLILTAREKHAVEITQNLKLDEYDAIAAISGDGLIIEIISGFLMRSDFKRALKMPLVHIPGGTSNGLASSICFQCHEPFSPRGGFYTEMAVMLVQPRYLPLRINRVETECDGDKAMFLAVSWGFLADIDIESERFRWAGMIRLQMEAVSRFTKLPKVAHYQARISYLPVDDKNTSQVFANLRKNLQYKNFTKEHFYYQSIESFTDSKSVEINNDIENGVLNMPKNDDLVQVPPLKDPVGSDWVVLEGYFVYVCLANLSHLGSDVPYLPCARLNDEFIYLTFVDWKDFKSQFQFCRMIHCIESCSHLSYPFLKVIPVRACRVEPLNNCGGHVTVDGEAITSGSAFQIIPTKHCATIIGRKIRN